MGLCDTQLYTHMLYCFWHSGLSAVGLCDLCNCVIALCNSLAYANVSRDLVHRYGVRIRVLGALALLPADVQAAAHSVMAATRDYKRYHLNICMPYTASREILDARDRLAGDVVGDAVSEYGCSDGCSNGRSDGRSGDKHTSHGKATQGNTKGRTSQGKTRTESERKDGAMAEFERRLLTGELPRVDALVRTSGETRLSDFLLWQVSIW